MSRGPAVYLCNTMPRHPFIVWDRTPGECAYCTLPRDEPEHEGMGEQQAEEETESGESTREGDE